MNASAIRRASNFTLANGASIPKLGLGTWKAPKGQVGPAVTHALRTGFRHVDCAWAYRNEDEVGEAISKSGIPRQQLWLTSKLWNSFHHPDHVEKGLDATLKDLGTDHLDLYLMHWPVAFINSNGSQIPSIKGQDGKPIEDVALSNNLSSTWEKMEEMVSKGKVRNIGISNFNIRRTNELLKDAKIKPAVNQVEVNWGVANQELLAWSEAHGIKLQAYSPLGSNNNVARYLEEPVVQEVASRNNMTPAQVFLAWSLGRGIITLPKSVTPSRLEENFKVLEYELPQADIDLLTREAQNKPIERTVDPSEAWGVETDIFEDGEDQRRAGELRSEAYHAPLPHENASRDHYLNPNHDDSKNNPSSSRSIHTHANLKGSRSSTRSRSTPIQTLLRSSGFNPRSGSGPSTRRHAFSTSSKAKATSAEAQPPSASEAPGISASSLLLRTSDKEAKATPGLRWTDEDSRSGESRKMNMYTVRTKVVSTTPLSFDSASASASTLSSASAHAESSRMAFAASPLHLPQQQQQQQRVFSSSSRARHFSTSSRTDSSVASSSTSSTSSASIGDSIPPSNLPPTLESLERGMTPVKGLKQRIYPERKRFLVSQYSRMLDESSVVMILQHNNLTVQELSGIREEIGKIEIPGTEDPDASSDPNENGNGEKPIRRKAKLTIVRSGLMRPVIKSHSDSNVRSLKPVFTGPIAVLTIPTPSTSSSSSSIPPDGFSPKYISSILSVLDKALGARKGQSGKMESKSGGSSVSSNPRLVLLSALALHGNVSDFTKSQRKSLSSSGNNRKQRKFTGFETDWTRRKARVLNPIGLRRASELPELKTIRSQIIGLLSTPSQQLMAVLNQAAGLNLAMTLEARKRDLEDKVEKKD